MEISELEVESKVSAVTVYQGRAMITRHVIVSLEEGNQVLIFTDLPEDLDRDSIQVKGTGEATLGECSYETEYFIEDVNSKKQFLLDKQQELSDSIAEISLILEACEKEKNFVERITGFITTPAAMNTDGGSRSSTSVNVGLNASTWSSMLDFYHGKNSEIDKLKLTSERQIRELEQELEKIVYEIENLGSDIQKSRNIIKVSLSKQSAGKLELDLSYMLSGPSWRPVYDFRALSDRDTVALEYNALVNQATGEDWIGVNLKLSTARVNISGILPELTPWYLYSSNPPSMPRMAMSKKMARVEESEMFDEISMSAASGSIEKEEIEVSQAEIETAGASVVFAVAGGGNINGDNSDTRVSLMHQELPVNFQYAAVPKITEFAFLTASITNKTDFPFLPGKVNIFLDGSFVSNSSFSLIMPDQEMNVSLGVDEGINIEYRYIKRFKKNEGIVNKRISEQFEYQIRVTNNRGKDIDITVYDQFPISEEKEISVKPLSPIVKDNQKEISLDDESKIKWQFKLTSGEKRELPFSYLIEYPPGTSLPGF